MLFRSTFRASATEDHVVFKTQGSRLIADFGFPVPLTPAGPDRFTGGPAGQVAFARDGAGKVTSVMVVLDADTTVYDRSTPPPSTAVDLAGYTGSYYSPELDVAYTLRAADSTLMLQVPGQAEAALLRTSRDSFAGPMGTAIRFNRSKANRIDGFLLFGGRVRNLRFTRK